MAGIENRILPGTIIATSPQLKRDRARQAVRQPEGYGLDELRRVQVWQVAS